MKKFIMAVALVLGFAGVASATHNDVERVVVRDRHGRVQVVERVVVRDVRRVRRVRRPVRVVERVEVRRVRPRFFFSF